MGSLRIIAGQLGGRRIRVPRGGAVRPTGERAREALFSILQPRLVGARLLDAYSGSGAFAFEALSRGAREVVLLEADRVAVGCLERNATDLGVRERCTIVHGRVLARIGREAAAGPFDLVLADPPYGSGETADFLEAVADQLALSAWVVVERDSRDAPARAEPGRLEWLRTRSYGRACFDFFGRPR